MKSALYLMYFFFNFSERARQMEIDVAPVPIITGTNPWFHGFGCITLFVNAIRRVRVVFLPNFLEEPFLHIIQVRL